MKKDVQKKGRQKRVSSGSASVSKRGDGLNSSKPVGKSDGYSKRKESRPSQNSYTPSNNNSYNTGGNYSSSSSSSNSGRQAGGLNLKRIITIAIIVIIGYFLLKSCMNIDLLDTGTTNFDSGSNVEQNTSSSSDASTQTVDYSVSNDARNKYTTLLGDGKDEITIMVFMCGSDLESRNGMATADLQEMLYGNVGGNVNVIVETGGASSWKNSVVSNRTNQRYQITSDGLNLVADNLGKKAMTEPDTLTDFINFCTDNYEANRYALIFWDHGGGSNQGFGHDEHFPRTTMSLAEIDDALEAANTKFDFVGFDACLMATYETAIMLNDHADYMIASEETEPGIGWYYTDWLKELTQNPSMSTVDIGKNIIDSFIEKCYQASPRDKTTLSIVDLAELAGTVPEVFNTFATSTSQLINSDEYKTVADARGYSREFGSPSQLNQIDLIHLAENLGTDEALALADTLEDCIKYNRTSNVMTNSNGLSIYFPYTTLSSMGSMVDTYEQIGMDKAYTDCIKGFASLEVGGQAISSGSGSPFGSLLGSFMGGDTGGSLVGSLLTSFIGGGGLTDMLGGSDTSWVDTDAMLDNTEYYEQNNLDAGLLELTQKNGEYVLELPQKDWDLIQNVQLNVFLDDGEGYIDLGMDNTYDFNDDGDLVMTYDGTWISLDGNVVAYYLIEEEWQGDNYAIVGRVPAKLNGELVDLIIAFTNDVPYGEVLGARLVYDDGSTAKGFIRLSNGDAIDFLCDYYTYDEEYYDSFYLGEQMVVDGEIYISNIAITNIKCLVTYQLTDIYNNTYWTPAIEYK